MVLLNMYYFLFFRVIFRVNFRGNFYSENTIIIPILSESLWHSRKRKTALECGLSDFSHSNAVS